uniref:Uncharacterized protein n=1 Tax=Lactuca sativa TaxID=4236 RepID=A0A9R1X9Y1_LACSA|nr:hypothetical protein LSAT_V11C500269550 [Lactuca sativa]
MAPWRIRATMDEIDIAHVFTLSIYINTFSIYDIDKMIEELGHIDSDQTLLYYHFLRPFGDLDFGLFALGCDKDVHHLVKYVDNHNLIDVYIEHRKTKLHTYYMSPNHSKIPHFEMNLENEDDDDGSKHKNGSGSDEFDDDSDSQDSAFFIEEDNLIHDVDVDMKDFHMNIDKDVEWVGGSSKSNVPEDTQEGDLDVINTKVLLSGSSSDEENNENIVKVIETNPKIPIRDLREQLQREYHMDISHMKLFREKPEALKHVQGDYTSQYRLLRDYILEVQARNPNTTVNIDVESEETPTVEIRTFRRIYDCIGALKRGL